MQYYQILAFVSLLITVFGHIELTSPPAFRGRTNPNTKNIDFDATSPLSGAGAFPCKGYHIAALADPTGEGKSTASWKAGGQASLTFSSGASHSGGSCQVSLSYDKGASWTVLHSFMGGCPLAPVSFTVPADAPAGKNVLGAWTWFNKIGNREMYMGCFSVDIDQGSGGSASTPFASRPAMFVANIGTNTCKVSAGKDAAFPNPGPDVTGSGDANSVSGECGPSAAGSSPGGNQPLAPGSEPIPKDSPVPISSAKPASSSAAGNSPVATPSVSSVPDVISAPAPSQGTPLPSMTTVFQTQKSTLTSTLVGSGLVQSASAGTASVPALSGSVPVVPSSAVLAPPSGSTPIAGDSVPTGAISSDGSCGGAKGQTCSGLNCCSPAGYCGTSALHCGTGCQPAFGKCKGGAIKGRRSVRIPWKN